MMRAHANADKVNNMRVLDLQGNLFQASGLSVRTSWHRTELQPGLT